MGSLGKGERNTVYKAIVELSLLLLQQPSRTHSLFSSFIETLGYASRSDRDKGRIRPVIGHGRAAPCFRTHR